MIKKFLNPDGPIQIRMPATNDPSKGVYIPAGIQTINGLKYEVIPSYRLQDVQVSAKRVHPITKAETYSNQARAEGNVEFGDWILQHKKYVDNNSYETLKKTYNMEHKVARREGYDGLLYGLTGLAFGLPIASIAGSTGAASAVASKVSPYVQYFLDPGKAVSTAASLHGASATTAANLGTATNAGIISYFGAHGLNNLTNSDNYKEGGRYNTGNTFDNIGNAGLDVLAVSPVAFTAGKASANLGAQGYLAAKKLHTLLQLKKAFSPNATAFGKIQEPIRLFTRSVEGSPIEHAPVDNQYFNQILEVAPKDLSLKDLTTLVADMIHDNNLVKSGFSSELLKSNFERHISDLLTDLGIFHKALSPNEILSELPKMARVEEPILYDTDLIHGYFLKDALPRLMRNFKTYGITLTPELETAIYELYTNPTKGVDMAFGYTTPGSGGYSRGSHYIRFPFGKQPSENTIVHELHHSVRDRLGTLLDNWGITRDWEYPENLISTDVERAWYLNNNHLYLPNELQEMSKLPFSMEDRAILHPDREIGATITSDFRFPLYRRFLQLNPSLPYTPKMLDLQFTNANPEVITRIFKSTDGYAPYLYNNAKAVYEANKASNLDEWKKLISMGMQPNGMHSSDWNNIKLLEADPFFSLEIPTITKNSFNRWWNANMMSFDTQLGYKLRDLSRRLAVGIPGVFGASELVKEYNK